MAEGTAAAVNSAEIRVCCSSRKRAIIARSRKRTLFMALLFSMTRMRVINASLSIGQGVLLIAGSSTT